MATGSYLLNSINEDAWFILPSTFETFEKVFNQKYVNGIKFETEESNVAVDPLLEMIGNKAIIHINGSMVRKAGFLDAMCGITSFSAIEHSFMQAMTDSQVDHVILNWDSPGGSAVGTPELANLIYSLRGTKRITSFISGSMCSAAFYIGSAADEIYASSSINAVGSIGVVAMHVDQSKADEMEGLKYTYIYAGKNKVDGNPHESLSPEVHTRMQSELQYVYSVFLNDVSKFRGVSVEEITKYAEGQVFKTGQVLGTPLLDGITTLNEILRS